MKACQDAGVTLGAFDVKVLTWLANYEPETCAVITGLITRANVASRAASRPGKPQKHERRRSQRQPRVG
jgi:hypothetical protein